MAQVQRATSSGGKQYLTQVLSQIKADTGYWRQLGFIDYIVPEKSVLDITVYIPSNFIITEAKVSFYHAPFYLQNLPNSGTFEPPFTNEWCYSRSVKLYSLDFNNFYRIGVYGSEYQDNPALILTEIPSAFGINGFTATQPSGIPPQNNIVENVETRDIRSYIKRGRYNHFRIQSAEPVPDYDTQFKEIHKKTGLGMATLTITGYRG